MALKKIHTYKGMHKYAQINYVCFGWCKSPIRKTIKTRFEKTPALSQLVIPEIALFLAVFMLDLTSNGSLLINPLFVLLAVFGIKNI